MTGYRAFEDYFGGKLEDSLVWIQFGFTKSPYLSSSFVKKYESKGCIHYQTPYYHYETLRCLCVDLKLSFKNLNILI